MLLTKLKMVTQSSHIDNNMYSPCFQTFEGATDYVLIRSYFSSAKKQKINIFRAIQFDLDGTLGKAIFIGATK